MERIVVNGRFLAQPLTGVQRYARETLAALDRALDESAPLRARFDVVLAVPAGVVLPTLRRIRVQTLGFLRGHAWEQLTLAAFARGAVLLNFSYSGPLFKRRQLVTIHDATAVVSPESFTASYKAVHHLMVRVLGRRAASVMTVSAFSRDEIARHFGLKREIVVGREGWEHALAHGDAQSTLARYGLRSGQFVLAVGSVKPNKNFHALEEALVLAPDLPWHIAIAGARNLGIFRDADRVPKNVRMLGYVSDEALGHLYQHAAWFVFPSLYEGFGLPAIEAMGNGCPVIAARAAAIPEVCGDAAVYFDPQRPQTLAQALQRVAAEPQLRDDMIARSHARLARYSWRMNAEIVLTQLASLAHTSHAATVMSSLEP